jgi:hypothetical protein
VNSCSDHVSGGYVEGSTATKANSIRTWLVQGDAFNSIEPIRKATSEKQNGSDTTR